MNVLISGATGLIGSALTAALSRQGSSISILTRSLRPQGPRQIIWDPARSFLDASSLEGSDAIVHLAGESIVGRWTAAKKARIKESRIQATRLLAEAAARMAKPPRVFISASAMGFYGDRGEEVLDEQSSAGSGFLSEVCEAWEASAQPAKDRGIRTVFLRTGIVLSKKGGALKKMLPIFQLGGGGVLGDGRQYWSWITLDDVIGVIQHALVHEPVAGPVNGVAPTPATNTEFTRVLARVLRRPAILPVPRFAARLLMGEMADALLFASARVVPKALDSTGYRFQFPELESALRHVLNQ